MSETRMMAKMPSANDRIVRVTAVLTDEIFGYEHWRAAQYCAPISTVGIERPALLVLCRDEAERGAMEDSLRGIERLET